MVNPLSAGNPATLFDLVGGEEAKISPVRPGQSNELKVMIFTRSPPPYNKPVSVTSLERMSCVPDDAAAGDGNAVFHPGPPADREPGRDRARLGPAARRAHARAA